MLELFLAAVFLPNLVPLVAMLSGIGTPLRTAAIIAYGIPVLLVRLRHPYAAVAVFLAVVVYDLIQSISLLFSLSHFALSRLLSFVLDVDLLASPLYVVVGLALLAITLMTVAILLMRQEQIKSARLGPSAVLLVGLVGIDLSFNASPHYLFGSAYAQGKPFRSAMIESGFADRLPSHDINVMVVMVEGWGHFVDSNHQALVEAPLRDPALTMLYEWGAGTTTYYGSTTSAEMLELCSTRQPYMALTNDGNSIACLPARLAQHGFTTRALHGFTWNMFDRHTWYPLVGFQKLAFLEQMQPHLTRTCGSVFEGACDVDVATMAAEALREPGGPRLVYWLTLNTHIPIQPEDGAPRFGCDTPANPFIFHEVCGMAELWTDVLEQIASIALDPALPPTAFLIVGDHAPPFWSRRARQLFVPGQVSWVSLWPRSR